MNHNDKRILKNVSPQNGEEQKNEESRGLCPMQHLSITKRTAPVPPGEQF